MVLHAFNASQIKGRMDGWLAEFHGYSTCIDSWSNLGLNSHRLFLNGYSTIVHNVFPMVTIPQWIPARIIHYENKYPTDLETYFQNGNRFHLIWILKGN